jgi:hypothetical protein
MAKDKTQQTPDSVDQIRNILFGEQIAIFERKFAEMDTRLSASIESILIKMDAMNKDIKSEITAIKSQYSSETSQMSKHFSTEIKSLDASVNNRITEIEADLLNQIQAGLNELDQKASHRNEMAKLLKEMADKLAD